MKDRSEIIERGWEALRAGRAEDAARLVETVYRGGEETDAQTVLSLSRFSLESGSLDRGRSMLVGHCGLFGDYKTALAAASLLEEIDARLPPAGRTVSIGILSDSTIGFLRKILEWRLKCAGIFPRIYEAPFGQVEAEVLDEGSGLYRFRPEVLLLILGGRDAGGEGGAAEEWTRRRIARLRGLWEKAHRRCGCHVLQGNWPANPWLPAPNAAGALPEGSLTAIRLLNARLTENLPPFVSLVDMDELAAEFGRWAWWDNRYYHAAKVPFALEAVPAAAGLAAALVRDLLGLGPKCAVVDLDNTLWGGILGEIGPSEIELGPTPEGEPYLDFQRYLRGLKERGFLLAVCSKNDPLPVREVFEKHEHMILRPGDIAAWRVNWSPKPASLREIAVELALGLDSFVFLDDNPAEREEVRMACPEVAVPVLPPDPSGYVPALVRSRLFEKIRLSEEDGRRAELYRQRRQAEEFRAAAASHDDFLAGLGMKARVERCGPANIARIHQLVSKTNQFNLTTKRMNLAELEAASADPAALCLGFHLEDRFGRHGLVGVLIAREQGDGMTIESLLLSCRVIGRGLEKVMLREAADDARRRRLSFLRGRFIPTAKNGLVKHMYDDLGFTLEGGGAEERLYSFPLAGLEGFGNHYIRVERSKGRDNHAAKA